MAEKVPLGYEATIPGWEDIVHIIPDRARQLEELREINRQRAERILRSPTPEGVRQVQEILTWIDDVQDALVTLSLISRVLVKYTGKVIPGARYVATAADALNLGTALEALGGGFPKDKRAARDLMRRSPASYRAKLLRTQRTGKVAADLADALQVLQTTDVLFGIGLSFGAIMGAPIDTLFLATTGGDLVVPLATAWTPSPLIQRMIDTGEVWGPLTELWSGEQIRAFPQPITEVRIPIPKVLPTIGELFGDPTLGALLTPTTAALEAANAALEGAAFLQSEGQRLSFADHLAVLAAQHLALQLVGGIAGLRDWTPDGTIKTRTPIVRRMEPRPHIASAMRAAGLDPRDPGRLALPGAPSETTWGTVLQTVPRAASAALPHWLSEAPTPGEQLFAAHLVWTTTNQYLSALEGPDAAKEETLTPEALAVELMLNAELPAGLWQNRPALEAAHRSVTDTLRILDARRLDPGTLLAAATAALAAHPLP